MTPATEEKRQQLLKFIEQILAPEEAVKGVVGIGSMASGQMHPDSDIDAVIFLDPYDLFIVPAESIWNPADNTFHSIFTDKKIPNGLQLDFARCHLAEWSAPAFAWPEGNRAELSVGWIAYDPSGEIAALIAQKTAYPDEIRQQRLDEALIWLDQHLTWSDPLQKWHNYGPVIAFDRLSAAYGYLVQALFAYNRQWQIWRNREMQELLNLPWLPDNFEKKVLIAANTPSLDETGYKMRAAMLTELFQELLVELTNSGEYSTMPVDQAFIRQNPEIGRAWNMEEWTRFHKLRGLT
ncbi:MAG: nucleotidyltransferase domain-containing protein [Anaerolineae bacterium]|nr:nucleotidyltransferase domain-containing protein [Anaerolineae bacterium]